ncbi:serine/threonine-protein kinase [Rubricoccus marinus]|uniref:Protein kinase domain-containing protein n=1 Tax=Rubricoccus marinus TaxID=716817 RepID=A0A259U175_9BACT|nr:serine/threonine-protein kinase [Rubricoccus marinus]OZC03607.1 hypothetical protein BSZ36_11800 [Rubricoccus marinus]
MTEAERHSRATDLFLELVARSEEERGAALLAEPDPLVRGAASALLRSHGPANQPSGGFLDTPVLEGPFRRPHAPGQSVGPWRIVKQIGEGGMGAVYHAARADGAYARDVALKLLSPAAVLTESESLADRLNAERQILARLEHPGISRLYDGGVTPDGIPYLAMELVDGAPITEAARDLPVRERVRLVIDACSAVAYAHGRLVIHRDIKPSNLHVAADGQVKLLDFGVASLLERDGGEALLTAPRALTPAYAAPEQLNGADITTATDVYSLGVLLFEVLARQRPYDLSGVTAAEAERIVCETPAPLASSVAPASDRRAIVGDLDTIVAKALEKDPARRYASAAALGEDLQRHLDGIPITARPASRAYRARLFVRRHRVGVVGTVAVAVALIGGLAGTAWQANAARTEAATAEAVSDFLVGLIEAADPREEGVDARVVPLLEKAIADLDSGLVERPEVEATLRLTLGVTFRQLGVFDKAKLQIERAIALRMGRFGAAADETLLAQNELGMLALFEGDYASADSILSVVLAGAERNGTLRADDLSSILGNVGYVRYLDGDLDESLALHQRAVDVWRSADEPDRVEMAASMGNVAVVLADLGRLDESAQSMEEQVAVYREELGSSNTRVVVALNNLGSVYYDLNRFDAAARVFREAASTARVAAGDSSEYEATALGGLGAALTGLGRLDDADRAVVRSMDLFRSLLGPDHPRVMSATLRVTRLRLKQNRLPEAEQMARETLRIARVAELGDDHPRVADARSALGEILLARGRAPEAARELRTALAGAEASLPEDHPDRASIQSLLGSALVRAGRTEEGIRLMRTGLAQLQTKPGPAAEETRAARERLRNALSSRATAG